MSDSPAPRGASAPTRRRVSGRLSRTRPPEVDADQGVWPSWTNLRVDQLNLDAFDSNGNLVSPRGLRLGGQ